MESNRRLNIADGLVERITFRDDDPLEAQRKGHIPVGVLLDDNLYGTTAHLRKSISYSGAFSN